MKRSKRKAFTYSLSMNATYGDSELELKDIISEIVADKNNSDVGEYEESINNVCDYLKELSGMQKNILICKLLDFDNAEIRAALKIPSTKYNDLINNMKRFEKEQYLRRVND